MKLTVAAVKKELEKNYGWENLKNESQKWFIDGLIQDTLKIVDEKLKVKETWYNEEQTTQRMNIIGQNGNDGEHYENK